MNNLKVIREYCSWLLFIVSVIVPHVFPNQVQRVQYSSFDFLHL